MSGLEVVEPVNGSADRLLALTPMAVEALAVRSGARRAKVVRTGMGAAKSRRTMARLAGSMPLGDISGVAILGVCGAIDDQLHPGDIVVAGRVRSLDDGLDTAVPGAPLIATALRKAGLSATCGTVVSAARVITGAERLALAGTGATAVDLESAALVQNAPAGLARCVLRAVVDTPEQELWSVSTLTGGVRALASLRRATAVLELWAEALRPRRVLLSASGLYRQDECELVLVLGDASAHVDRSPSVMLGTIDDLDLDTVAPAGIIGIAQASAPAALMGSLLSALSALGPLAISEGQSDAESISYSVPLEDR